VLLIEAHALILSTLGISRATRFLQRVPVGRIVTVRVRASDEEWAKQILFHHFEQYGFTIASPDTIQ